MNENIVVSLKNVNIARDENVIFENFSLEVKAGEFVYLIGKVGSGKSTLLKSLYREVPILSGDAQVLGIDIVRLKKKHLPKLRRQLGIVFQDFQLLADKTVYENLNIVLRATTSLTNDERKIKIQAILSEIGLTNKGYKYPHELSGGEQQRVAIGRAIIVEPKIIIADEPTANLDEENGIAITRLLQKLSKEKNIAVLMATHNKAVLNEVEGKQICIGEVAD